MDKIIRAITADGMVKATAITSRDLTERARQIHKTLPVATAALGRTLAAASMMGNALKDGGASLTIQVRGGGPLGAIVVVSDNAGNVRGYVEHPAVDLPLRPDGKLDVGAAVGADGTLTVIKDLNMKDPYVGSVQLLGGEIAEDIAQYFVESEQIPTACALGVLVDRDQSVHCAGGYLIQLLPGAGEDVISRVEAGVYAAGAVTKLLAANDDPGGHAENGVVGFRGGDPGGSAGGIPLHLQPGTGGTGADQPGEGRAAAAARRAGRGRPHLPVLRPGASFHGGGPEGPDPRRREKVRRRGAFFLSAED